MTVRATTSTHAVLRPQEFAAVVDLRRYPVHARLSRQVERCWSVHWDLRGRAPYTARNIPHPCVNITVTSDSAAHVHGVFTTTSTQVLRDSGWAFGVKFRPGGFHGFAGASVTALTDRAVPLSEFVGPEADQLAESVVAAASDHQRRQLLESFVRARLPAPEEPLGLVTDIVATMLEDRSITHVHHVGARFGLSVRTLQRLFHRYVGVGPKWVIRRYRLQDVADLLARGDVVDLSALALELGFFDQAHLSRDFSALVGTTPTEYARACKAAAETAPAPPTDVVSADDAGTSGVPLDPSHRRRRQEQHGADDEQPEQALDHQADDRDHQPGHEQEHDDAPHAISMASR
ncbi:helix-turn-helix domain-containing protein [Haloactinopolyspora sp.]|uniref:AraC family transcriptional regulator n=1 Tax=Haloactinopolyspora sp. TaxID=1966353 RepID=UPI0026242543|nr:helix-turn-helix domain-containing protein [Haloactinopolyspora sp.]